MKHERYFGLVGFQNGLCRVIAVPGVCPYSSEGVVSNARRRGNLMFLDNSHSLLFTLHHQESLSLAAVPSLLPSKLVIKSFIMVFDTISLVGPCTCRSFRCAQNTTISLYIPSANFSLWPSSWFCMFTASHTPLKSNTPQDTTATSYRLDCPGFAPCGHPAGLILTEGLSSA